MRKLLIGVILGGIVFASISCAPAPPKEEPLQSMTDELFWEITFDFLGKTGSAEKFVITSVPVEEMDAMAEKLLAEACKERRASVAAYKEAASDLYVGGWPGLKKNRVEEWETLKAAGGRYGRY